MDIVISKSIYRKTMNSIRIILEGELFFDISYVSESHYAFDALQIEGVYP